MFWFCVVGALAATTVYIVTRLNKLRFGICQCSRHLVGKTVIVTGSNTGIGFETARDFAERGARVILACRTEAKTIAARDAIISSTDNKDVYFYKLDLSSLKSVRDFVDEFKRKEKRLDILVNNAGDLDLEEKITEDGLLLGMQVNYFGPFLLTNLLLPMLKSSALSRIVNVASAGYKIGKIDLQDLNKVPSGPMSTARIYANAKLCFILMTIELSRMLKDTGVTVNTLCPGYVKTNIMQKIRNPVSRFFMNLNASVFAKTALEGAQTQIYLSVSPEVKDVSGCYFDNCKKEPLKDFASDPVVAKKLWEVSERLVHLQ